MSWRDRTRRPAGGPSLGWRRAGYAILVVAGVIVAFTVFTIVREVQRPTSSNGEPASLDRPSPAECSDLLQQVAKPSGPVTSELRARLRRCFEKR